MPVKPRLAIIGAGRTGSALAAALSRAGWTIAAVASRRAAAARRLARLCGAVVATTDPVRAASSADVVIIAVPDREIPRIARTLASVRTGTLVPSGPEGAGAERPRHRPRPAHRRASRRRPSSSLIVLHTSGASGRELLDPIARAGASTGSLHPLISFPPSEPGPHGARRGRRARGRPAREMPFRQPASPPRLAPGSFTGATFAVDGDPAARRIASALAGSMGGRVLPLSSSGRAAYHLAACFASNYVVTLVAEATRLIEQATSGERALGEALETILPLLRSTIANLETSGLPDALTGPVARGDAATIARHAGVLRGAPADLRALHRALVARTAQIALEAGWLDRKGLVRIGRSAGATRSSAAPRGGSARAPRVSRSKRPAGIRRGPAS